MRYGDLARLYAPVIAHAAQRRPTPAPAPAPESGARWGKASEFAWSNEAALSGRERQQSVAIEYPEGDPPEYMRIIGADLKVMAERVKVRAPGDPETWIEIDRVTRMAFHYTEFPPKPDPSALQPSMTTYYDLEFAHHPPEEAA